MLDKEFVRLHTNYKNDIGSWVVQMVLKNAVEMRKILTTVGAVKFANTSWGYQGAPNKGTVENKDITEEMVREDYRRFTDKFLSVPLSSLYMGVLCCKGYLLHTNRWIWNVLYGSKSFNLKVPKFNGALRLRIRLKRGGSTPIYNYRFTTMHFK